MSDEIILAIISAVTALGGGIVTYVIRRLNQADAERRFELETTRQQRDRLRKRVTDLEEKSKRLPIVESQLGVAFKQIEELQDWKGEAVNQLQQKDAEITRLNAENDRVKKQNTDLFDANKKFQAQHATWEKVITILALNNSDKPDPEPPPEPEPFSVIPGGKSNTDDKADPEEVKDKIAGNEAAQEN